MACWVLKQVEKLVEEPVVWMVEKEEIALVQKTADILGFTWLRLEVDQDATSEESFDRGQNTEHGLDVVDITRRVTFGLQAVCCTSC